MKNNNTKKVDNAYTEEIPINKSPNDEMQLNSINSAVYSVHL